MTTVPKDFNPLTGNSTTGKIPVTNPVSTTPVYGTQASNAAPGQVNVYDPNTGTPLAGAGAYNPNNGAKIQQTPINASIIGNTNPLNLPPTPTPSYDGTLAGAMAGVTSTPTGATTTPTTPPNTSSTPTTPPPQKTFKDTLAEVLGMIKPPTSTADTYAQAEKDAGIEEKKNLVNSYTNQLNAINAQAQADTLALTNQGRGITTGLIRGQQAEILKQSAIKALPLSALLSAAQGDLATAQTHLDNYFKLVTADNEAQTKYYNDAVNTAYDLFSKSEQQRLDDIKTQKATDTASMRDAVNNAQTLAKSALDNGDTVAVQALTKLTPPDPNSATFQQDLQNYNNQIATITSTMKPDALKALQLKQAQLNIQKTQQDLATSTPTTTINGKPQTATQSAANLYGDRLNQADVVIGLLGNKFTGKFQLGSILPNALQSGDRQAFEQAKKNFVTAVLRRESGASISPTEFKTADEQYFPQPGDKPAVLAQKEALRNTVINNFYKEANVLRPVLPNQIIQSGGKKYKVGIDGETLTEIK